MTETTSTGFNGCSIATARKKLLLGGNVIACVNVTSKNVIKERKNVETIEEFDEVHKNYKHFFWSVKR